MSTFSGRPVEEWRLETSYQSGYWYHYTPHGTDCWAHTKNLGGGTFGEVCQEICLSGPSANRVRAVKQIRRDDSWASGMSIRELDALITFSDDRVVEYSERFVQFFGWFDDSRYLYLAMEYMEHGDLQKCIKPGRPFPEHEAVMIVTQVAEALRFMHQKSFVHRDIKPLNILVASPRPNWRVKVADFGITKQMNGTVLGTLKIGTAGYMAPELLDESGAGYTAAVDIWALGAVTFCLRTGSPPFLSHKHMLQFSQSVKTQRIINALGDSRGWCIDFVLKAMAECPNDRLTIEQALQHEWLTKPLGLPESLPRETTNTPAGITEASNTEASNTWSAKFDSSATPQLRLSESGGQTSPSPYPSFTSETVVLPSSLIAAPPMQNNFNYQMMPGSPSSAAPKEEDLQDGLLKENEDIVRTDKTHGREYFAIDENLKLPSKKSSKLVESLTNTAIELRQQKLYKQAERVQEEVIKTLREEVGDCHLVTIQAIEILAAIFEDQAEYDNAESSYRRVYDLRYEADGYMHPTTLTVRNKIITLYRRRGKADLLESFLQHISQMQQETLGEKHPGSIEARRAVARICHEHGKYTQSEDIYRHIYTLLCEELPAEHPDVVSALRDLKAAAHREIKVKILGIRGPAIKRIFGNTTLIAELLIDGMHVHTTGKSTEDKHGWGGYATWDEMFTTVINNDSIVTINVRKPGKSDGSLFGSADIRVRDSMPDNLRGRAALVDARLDKKKGGRAIVDLRLYPQHQQS